MVTSAKLTLSVVLLCSVVLGTEFEPQQYLKHVKFLASEKLKGRGTGTAGLEKAADYITSQFKSIGLEPAGEDGRYSQSFQVTVRAQLGKRNSLVVVQNGKRQPLKLKEDFQPLNFSATAKHSCSVVFAGYGITAPEYHYDDYAGLDVKDKCVLVLRYEPQEFDEKSVWMGKAYTTHAQLPSKAFNARNRGARAILFINNMVVRPGESDQLETFGRTSGPANAGIAFLQLKSAIAEQWFKASGKDLTEIVKSIDQDLKPRSFALPDTLRLDLESEVTYVQKRVRNVAGYLPGESDEYVIIGAHYDHLGLGEQSSLAPSQIGVPHVGADDNASGTAGLIELARYFAQRPRGKRGILFLAFAGEELGLLGSAYFVNHPTRPLNKAVAMINMDMIGRVQNNRIFVGGSGTGSNLKEVLDQVKGQVELSVDLSEKSGYGSSDHTSFTTKEVPVLFFFSGLHADYHKPSDTWDKINAAAAVRVLRLVAGVTEKLQASERPLYVKVEPPKMPTSGGSGSGYGPYFGSIPDFAEVPNGVRFSDIRPGSPAAKAGLKGGDILIEFDGKQIQNLYDYTYALRMKKPGDEVTVKVLREGKPVEFRVVLEQRR
ncbi:MAG: M28 family peptidase [Bryobacteraceae bacterium]|nr:M28 family peptidase [Bryobacteraceae bacterium]MDW8376783.1 M28 family peptidase [Bryobacterales bacterium]